MDKIKTRLDVMQWTYAERDERAFRELCRRVAETGKREDLETYTGLVAGVTFQMENVEGGEPFQIDTKAWLNRDREILGSFLGRICQETYRRGGFMGSALVVSSQTKSPSGGFWDLMCEIQAFESKNAHKRDEFWLEQVQLAYHWYRNNEW